MGYGDFFYILSGENKDCLNVLMREILDVFEKIKLDFDDQPRNIEHWDREYPQFSLAEENIQLEKDTIYLSVNNYLKWNQTVYQISHELTHCFIHCHNTDKRYYANWIEETICEAMSLYFLAHFRDNWADTPFYPYDPNYSNCFAKYLNDIEVKEGNSRLSNCRDYKELMDIDRTSQAQREDRKNEMLGLYRLISERNIKGLIYYRDYIVSDRKILNCAEYRAAYPYNFAVKYLCDLQDKILHDNKAVEIA